MKENQKGVLEGKYKLSGNQACAEGAISAGCRFLGYHPITPSFEIVERYAQRCGDVDGVLIQMEDEISVLAAVLGASWTGRKAITVTSGPGLSLMLEHVGLGVMLETPCVIVDVQRGGPSEGLPNSPGSGDVMQARWGSHGDYELIALSPNSPQDMFDLTIEAFNFSEKYRTPVLIMADEAVGHMTDEVVISPPELVERKYYRGPKEKYLPYKWDKDLIPPMVDIGQGYKFHVTGLTHDERGYPVMDEYCQEWNVHRLIDKIRLYSDEIVRIEEEETEDADVVVVSYGISSQDAQNAVKRAREDGIKAGSLRLVTIWPFPEKQVTELARKVKTLIVAEMNYGQIFYEVERCSRGSANTVLISRQPSQVHHHEDILEAIKKV